MHNVTLLFLAAKSEKGLPLNLVASVGREVCFQLTENHFHVLEQNLKFIKWYFYTLSSGVADDKVFCMLETCSTLIVL